MSTFFIVLLTIFDAIKSLIILPLVRDIAQTVYSIPETKQYASAILIEHVACYTIPATWMRLDNESINKLTEHAF